MTRQDQMGSISAPWYRQVWPWLLMLGPFVVVVAAFVTLWLAIRSNDGLVADDYYKQGLGINQVLDRRKRAQFLQLGASLRMVGPDLALTLSGHEGLAFPLALRLTFSHPTRSGFDRAVNLSQVSNGRYRGAMPTLAAGYWLVQLEDADRTWRLTGSGRVPDQREFDLGVGDL